MSDFGAPRLSIRISYVQIVTIMAPIRRRIDEAQSFFRCPEKQVNLRYIHENAWALVLGVIGSASEDWPLGRKMKIATFLVYENDNSVVGVRCYGYTSRLKAKALRSVHFGANCAWLALEPDLRVRSGGSEGDDLHRCSWLALVILLSFTNILFSIKLKRYIISRCGFTNIRKTLLLIWTFNCRSQGDVYPQTRACFDDLCFEHDAQVKQSDTHGNQLTKSHCLGFLVTRKGQICI